jgi:hypothetical protein
MGHASKFIKAIPLTVRKMEWRTLGVNLSRATMANWIMAASRDWLMPVLELMHRKLLQEKYLHADETTVQDMNEGGVKTLPTPICGYTAPESTAGTHKDFEYQPGRSGKYPQKF